MVWRVAYNEKQKNLVGSALCRGEDKEVLAGNDGLPRTFTSDKMVAGMWNLGDTKPKQYKLR
jgi:hypothetical protein